MSEITSMRDGKKVTHIADATVLIDFDFGEISSEEWDAKRDQVDALSSVISSQLRQIFNTAGFTVQGRIKVKDCRGTWNFFDPKGKEEPAP